MNINRNFSNIFYPPESIEINNRTYIKYLVKFQDLYEIYDYLKSNPSINRKIFKKLSSKSEDANFAGMPYEEAVENLINFDEKKYLEFLHLVRELTSVRAGYKHEYELKRTLAGGHLNVPLYSSGSPLCYESYERVKKPKFINIYASLSYPWFISKRQILNRAIILISIINALEKNNYVVNLSTFELSQKQNELINIIVNLKNYGERVNIQTLYKTSQVEFLRRILFRILETMPVKNNWEDGYGKACGIEMAREIFNIKGTDIYFGSPDDLDIKGEDLAKDFASCLKKLNLHKQFDVRRIDSEFRERVKRLV